MLRQWKKSPGLRLLLPFLCGIAADHVFHPALQFWLLVIAPLLAIYLCIHIFIRRWRFVYRFAPGLALVPLLFCAGVILHATNDPLLSPSHYVSQYRPDDLWMARLTSVPVMREKTVRVEAEVIGLDRSGKPIVTSGKIIITLENDSASQQIGPDDILAISSRMKKLNPPANPGEFDYAVFLENRFIYRQAYVKSSEWILAERATTHSFSGYFLLWREFFIDKFRSHVDGKEEFSVLAALILGKTEFIEQDMMQAYASAGAIHILAVSGLHVGLIYVVLAPLLRKIFPGKSKKWLKFLIPASILWLYAGVTGFSPSVLRAALMFTAFIIAETWERNSSSYNTIGISAFLLLCWNPRMIAELGFQLSYLAVLGIIMLQKKIADALPWSNKWMQKIWQLSAVTLAAQITTFPISIYYFHQFPVYFLFSNLIVIPVSTILLYAGLVFLIVCWLPHAADVAANISSTITTWMNSIIQWFDHLPMSTLRGFAPGIPEVILLYALMWTLTNWLFWKKKRALVITIGIAALLISLQAIRWEKDSKQNLCCIHAIRNHICLTTIIGDDAYIITDSSVIASEQTRKFHLDNFLLERGVAKTTYIDYSKQSAFEDHQFRFENGIIQTSDFTLGWWNQIDEDKP
ncbi:MAG: ComEC/Rec2 family competence protein, partial [Flavobacteriales bacterium]